MAESHEAHCPECGATLEAGFIGYFSGIVWHDKELTEWQRLIPFVFGPTRFIIGNVTSTPWIRSREARKCRVCGTLVVPT